MRRLLRQLKELRDDMRADRIKWDQPYGLAPRFGYCHAHKWHT